MKEFINSNGAKFIVGQTASENEYLTLLYKKNSRKDILWFHIDKVPGPHVILIPDELNELSISDIQEAANYTVNFTKKDNNGYVTYCNIQDVYKNRTNVSLGEFTIVNSKRIKGFKS